MASEEPHPVTAQDAATDDAPAVPKSAKEAKTAKAMSKLDSHGDDDSALPKGDVDSEALGAAMKSLTVGEVGETAKVDVKKIKVEAADVTLVMNELLLSKMKATDLLKAHDGDAVEAMTAYVTAPVC